MLKPERVGEDYIAHNLNALVFAEELRFSSPI